MKEQEEMQNNMICQDLRSLSQAKLFVWESVYVCVCVSLYP